MGLAAGAAVTLLAGGAQAYPQWQFSSGTSRCSTCHLSPSGGGAITGYARDAVGEDLSTFEGNGAFLHGAVSLPSRLSLGGDLRGALLAKDVQNPDGSTLAAFPMQAEINGAVKLPRSFSFYANVGLRGQVRDNDAVVPTQNYQPMSTSRLISREHYLTWRPSGLGPYARAGRFYAPFGLRLAEHFTYVRRDLGFNMLEETYNLNGGYLAEDWEVHVTAFAPDVLRHIGSLEKGASAYFEHRILDDTGALGAQARLAFGEGMDRLIVGGVAKYYLEPIRTLLLGEANLVRQMFDGGGVSARHQFVATAGASVLPVRGLMITVLGERNQVDLTVRDDVWNAATGLVSWFPYAHFELQLMSQLQFPAGGRVAKTALLQVHYFL
jgi:hypothetical protein